MLMGGTDVNPARYGEPPHPETEDSDDARDELESALITEALDRDLPILAICRGMQILNVQDGGTLKISREIEGGNKEMHGIDLPCVLSIQTGINEPRYVGMRGIRQVASRTIPTFDAAGLGLDEGAVGVAAAKVKRLDYFVPAAGKGAEMLEGSREEIIDRLIELLKAKGGLN